MKEYKYGPLSSKKFIAAFVAVIILSGLCVLGMLTQTVGWPLAMVLGIAVATIGFIAVGVIQGQAGLDKYEALIGSVVKPLTARSGGINDSRENYSDYDSRYDE